MSENKSQHYVPQFYLRSFSATGKSVGLFVLKSGLVRPQVGIKDQCARDYFYSKDITVEQNLSRMVEGPSSEIIRNVIASQGINSLTLEEISMLRLFVLTLEARTAASARGIDEATEFIGEEGVKPQLAASGKLTMEEMAGIKLRVTEPALYALALATEMLPLINDLEPALLVSPANDLITSDHPVVLLNPYMNGTWNGSNIGYALLGLQIVLPLSPNAALFFYDPTTYSTRRDESGAVRLSASDVVALNQLQLLNCEDCAYFKEEASGPEISRTFEKLRQIRVTERSHSTILSEQIGDSEVRRVIGNRRTEVELQRQVSFFSVLPARRKIPRGHRLPLALRDPDIVSAFEMFREACVRGEYTRDKFPEFVRDQQAAVSIRRAAALVLRRSNID